MELGKRGREGGREERGKEERGKEERERDRGKKGGEEGRREGGKELTGFSLLHLRLVTVSPLFNLASYGKYLT